MIDVAPDSTREPEDAHAIFSHQLRSSNYAAVTLSNVDREFGAEIVLARAMTCPGLRCFFLPD